jgi:hypothetical protein
MKDEKDFLQMRGVLIMRDERIKWPPSDQNESPSHLSSSL